MATTLGDVRTLHEKKRLIIGQERTIKALKSGMIAKVILASNAPKETKADMVYYSALSGIEVVELDKPNEELGATCRKPLPISVIGVRKE